ncbi:MAG: DUF4258 domain-containing protein [Nanoarchaeota archaeon]
MITIVSFIFSLHALQKMDALGIEKKEVENIIKKGMKWKEDRIEKWHSLMNNIEVVFQKSGDEIFIITIYKGEREK